MNETDRPGVGEEGADKPKKRRAGGDFLSSWLLRRERPLELPEEKPEGSKEGPEKKEPKGFRKLFNRFFPNLVKKEMIEPKIERPEPVGPAEARPDMLQDVPAEPVEALTEPVKEEINVQTQPEVSQEKRTYPAPPEVIVWESNRPQPARSEAIIPARQYVAPERDGAGVATGLVVDQLSRRRDRKLKRAIKRSNKEIKKLQDKTEKLARNLEKAAREDYQAKGELRIPHPETVIVPQQRVESAAERKTEKVPTEGRAEKLQNILNDRKEELEKVKAGAASPDVILEKVAEAAEKNEPIEAVFERRHEAKDQKADKAKVTGGAFVSHPGYNSPGTEPEQPSWFKPISSYDKPLPTNVPAPSLYKKAAVSGFYTGLVVFAAIVAMLWIM